jgi:hypothetical protein
MLQFRSSVQSHQLLPEAIDGITSNLVGLSVNLTNAQASKK